MTSNQTHLHHSTGDLTEILQKLYHFELIYNGTDNQWCAKKIFTVNYQYDSFLGTTEKAGYMKNIMLSQEFT